MAADNPNVVLVTAGLTNALLTSPAIGTNGLTGTVGFNNGDLAEDVYTAINASTPTALNTALGGTGGFIMINNPSTVATVALSVGATALGSIPVAPAAGTPFAVVLPVSSTAIINAQSSAGSVTLGITIVKTTAN